MATWDNKRYDEEATSIAKRFVAGMEQNGASLNDLVEKTARANNLNPEQIRRLTRVSNIRAWETRYEQMKTAADPDRNVEFQVGNDIEVIRRLHGVAKDTLSKTASVESPRSFPDLGNEMDMIRRPEPETPAHIKVAAAPEIDTRRLSMELLKMERLAETIEVRQKASSLGWRGALEEVLRVTRNIDWSTEKHAQLERDAVNAYGMEVVPELNALRRLRGEPLLELSSEKVASLNDRVVARPNRLASLLKTASEERANLRALDAAKVTVTERTETLRTALKLRG